MMGEAYPELRTKADYMRSVITAEEVRIGRKLATGLEQLDRLTDRMRAEGSTVLRGEEAFRLHDTFGFPLNLTAKILHERGLGVDEAGFITAMEGQRQKGRSAAPAKRGSGTGI